MKWSRKFEDDSDVFVAPHSYIAVEVVKDDSPFVRVLLAFDPERIKDPMATLISLGPGNAFDFAEWAAFSPEIEELGFVRCNIRSVPVLEVRP